MQTSRGTLYLLLVLALAIAAVSAVDARTDELMVFVRATLLNEAWTPAMEARAGDWLVINALIELPAGLALVLLTVGGLPMALAGIAIDWRTRDRAAQSLAGQARCYTCLIFLTVSLGLSVLWLMPLVLLAPWQGFTAGEGTVATYFGAQLAAGALALPSWRRLSRVGW
jgi:hypothetical protein